MGVPPGCQGQQFLPDHEKPYGHYYGQWIRKTWKDENAPYPGKPVRQAGGCRVCL